MEYFARVSIKNNGKTLYFPLILHIKYMKFLPRRMTKAGKTAGSSNSFFDEERPRSRARKPEEWI